jgi:hypothetical protein
MADGAGGVAGVAGTDAQAATTMKTPLTPAAYLRVLPTGHRGWWQIAEVWLDNRGIRPIAL